MIGLENLAPEIATDLIALVNSLQGLTKRSKVNYSVQNKTTGTWTKKEFSYVPLDDILEKIKENTNFAFMQPLGFDKEIQKVGIKCVLIHKSGKYLESDLFPIETKDKTKIQDEGAEITYRKRYAAGAFFGLATEEDTDGNGNDGTPTKDDSKIPRQQKIVKATDKQIETIQSIFTPEEIAKALNLIKREKIDDMTVQEASSLIASKKKKAEAAS